MTEPDLLHHLLANAARQSGTRCALRCGDQVFDYETLWARSLEVAAGLRARGVRAGDRVLLMMENSAEFATCFFGALACGAMAVPVSPQTREARLAFMLGDCEPSAVMAHAATAPVCDAAIRLAGLTPLCVQAGTGELQQGFVAVDALRTRADEALATGVAGKDAAAIIYTSGSTGQPKGVLLSHRNMLTAARSIQAYLELRPSDVIFCGLPLSFDYGLYQLLLAAQVGASVVLERNMTFTGHVMKQLSDHAVTVLPGVPTAFELLLRVKSFNAGALPSLRMLTNTGAALSQGSIAKLRAAFPAAQLFSMYGLTECKRVSFLPPDQLDRRPGSIGRGMPNQEVWLVDDSLQRLAPGSTGELVVSGEHVMLGYWQRPEETAAVIYTDPASGKRCLRTGDIMLSDSEGFMYFVGRRDDIIKSSGQKVAPREVEAAIEELAGVAEVAVVGIPDALQGQIVKAFVALLPGQAYQEHEILAHCRSRLEAFMVPARVEIRRELPHRENGKVDRQRLLA